MNELDAQIFNKVAEVLEGYETVSPYKPFELYITKEGFLDENLQDSLVELLEELIEKYDIVQGIPWGGDLRVPLDQVLRNHRVAIGMFDFMLSEGTIKDQPHYDIRFRFMGALIDHEAELALNLEEANDDN